jgi:hypothetical protein
LEAFGLGYCVIWINKNAMFINFSIDIVPKGWRCQSLFHKITSSPIGYGKSQKNSLLSSYVLFADKIHENLCTCTEFNETSLAIGKANNMKLKSGEFTDRLLLNKIFVDFVFQ